MTLSFLHVPTLTSTNTFAKELVGAYLNSASTDPTPSDPAYTVITCDKQTRGYGTHGRTWDSLPGNLFFSLIWPLEQLASRHTGDLALVTGFAVLSWARPLLPRERLTLKWPNDVQVNGLKMAGILIEIEPPYAIVGIGVNIASSPTRIPEATHLNRYLAKPAKAALLLPSLLDSLTETFRRYQAQGLSPLIPLMLPFFVKNT